MHFPNYGLSKTWLYKYKKYRFRIPLDKEHGKLAQTLLKSERRDVYHIC